jgi:hypothetical protein
MVKAPVNEHNTLSAPGSKIVAATVVNFILCLIYHLDQNPSVLQFRNRGV